MRQVAAREQTFKAYVLPEVEVLLRAAVALTARPVDAEDLVRDTLLRAYHAIDRLDGQHPRVWLLDLMRRAEIDRQHRLAAAGTRLDRSASAGEAASPQDVVNCDGFDEAVGAALTSLPDKHRLAVRLVDMGGLSYTEAAGLLGVPEGTVMHRVHRARRRMRARLAVAGAVP
jgi:RNA polymerase sigma-70 factor (ECF subfamily)